MTNLARVFAAVRFSRCICAKCLPITNSPSVPGHPRTKTMTMNQVKRELVHPERWILKQSGLGESILIVRCVAHFLDKLTIELALEVKLLVQVGDLLQEIS